MGPPRVPGGGFSSPGLSPPLCYGPVHCGLQILSQILWGSQLLVLGSHQENLWSARPLHLVCGHPMEGPFPTGVGLGEASPSLGVVTQVDSVTQGVSRSPENGFRTTAFLSPHGNKA